MLFGCWTSFDSISKAIGLQHHMNWKLKRSQNFHVRCSTNVKVGKVFQPSAQMDNVLAPVGSWLIRIKSCYTLQFYISHLKIVETQTIEENCTRWEPTGQWNWYWLISYVVNEYLLRIWIEWLWSRTMDKTLFASTSSENMLLSLVLADFSPHPLIHLRCQFAVLQAR